MFTLRNKTILESVKVITMVIYFNFTLDIRNVLKVPNTYHTTTLKTKV